MSDCKTDCETPVFEDPEVVPLMRGSVADLQRAAEVLERYGIEAGLVKSSDTDASGCCSTTIYLVVARDDAPAALSVFDEEWKRGLTEEQLAALEAAATVIADDGDPNEITCPACLTTFATGPTECPECGLSIG
jgi:hypothetical protein